MKENLNSRVSMIVNVPAAKVWDALTNPKIIKEYMFGTDVVATWKVGEPILWKGMWKDKPYEDRGVVIKIVENQTLQFTYFSALSGQADVPENYHTLTYRLQEDGTKTLVTLTQDNNATEDDQQHAQQMWENMFATFKKVVEK